MPSYAGRSNANSNTSTTITTTFPSNSATNILIAVIKTGIAGNTTSIADTAGNTWVSAGFIDGASWRLQVWYAENCKFFATTNTITVTVAASATNILAVAEYSGTLTSGSFSVEAAANGTGTTLSSGSLTVTPGDLMIGAGFASSNSGVTAGAGFTGRAGSNGLLLEDKTSTSAPDSATITAASGTWSMIGVSFHLAPTGPLNISPVQANTNIGVNHQPVKGPAQVTFTPTHFSPVPIAANLKGGITGTAYSETIGAQGGTSPYTFAVTSGALPTGTTLNSSSGVISGTPSAASTFSFTITVTDSLGFTGSQAFQIIIAAPSGSGGGSYTFLA